MDVHQSVGHLSQENVQISLRQKYWVFKGRAKQNYTKKSNRIQITVNERNAETIRKMCV